jgi:predicted transcriptional regulator of viral defense system
MAGRAQTQTDLALLGLARRRSPLTSLDVAHAFGLSRAQAQLLLRRLSDDGLLDRWLGEGGEYAHALAPAGEDALRRGSVDAAEPRLQRVV